MKKIPLVEATDEDFKMEKRTEKEINRAAYILAEQVWYNRHKNAECNISDGKETCDPKVWKKAEKAARKVEREIGKENLGPHTDFEWGMINGKLSALRWLNGEEWDSLYT